LEPLSHEQDGRGARSERLPGATAMPLSHPVQSPGGPGGPATWQGDRRMRRCGTAFPLHGNQRRPSAGYTLSPW
jgi:hypothetical protein